MSSSETPPAASPGPAETSAAPNWTQRIKKIVGIALAVVFGLIGIIKIITWNDLPGCDSKRAKDTLSDIFKQKNIDAARYDQIATVSTSENEVVCNAELTLTNKNRIFVEYSLFKQGSDVQLKMAVKAID